MIDLNILSLEELHKIADECDRLICLRTGKFNAAYPLFPVELDAPEFRTLWTDFIKGRRERGHTCKQGWCVRKLDDLADFGLEVAFAAVEESHRQGWMGVFPEKHVKRSALADSARAAQQWAEEES